MDTITTEALSSTEAYKLRGHEQVIEQGLATFNEVGGALLAIRDERLYRATHGTFEAYCEERWNISRSRAYRLMEASEVMANLSPIGDTHPMPDNEAQVRELAKVIPEAQLAAWAAVVETAPEGKVTANHMAVVAHVFDEMLRTGEIDPGDGIAIAKSDILKAAITEETSERLYRQQEHIRESMERKAAREAGEPAGAAEYELYTPEWLITKARQALGGEIDLDPASCKEAQTVVRANRYFDIEIDGLKQPWVATSIWVNPPYGNGYNKPWAEKIVQEFMGGGMLKGLVLQQAAVGAPWFQLFADFPRCHLSQRVAFWGPADKGFGPRFDSVIFALGISLDAFAEAFEDVGHIYVRYQRGSNGHH